MTENVEHNNDNPGPQTEPAFHDGAPASHGVGHIVPIKYLVTVAVALLALTWLTVAVMAVNLGEANIYIALAIAVVKASLVMLFFMHLWWDRAFNSFAFITSVAAVLVFILFALTDTTEYQKDVQSYRAANEANGDSKKAQDRLTLETVPDYEKALNSGELDQFKSSHDATDATGAGEH